MVSGVVVYQLCSYSFVLVYVGVHGVCVCAILCVCACVFLCRCYEFGGTMLHVVVSGVCVCVWFLIDVGCPRLGVKEVKMAARKQH